jgi:hypothetical protein
VGLYWQTKMLPYIQSRSARYAGALDIEPAWTAKVMADERLVEVSPYPTSRVGGTGFIGYRDRPEGSSSSSPTATSTAISTA